MEVQERPSLWTRMKNGLSDTMHSIARGAENFAVWFVVNLPLFTHLGGSACPLRLTSSEDRAEAENSESQKAEPTAVDPEEKTP